MPCKTHHDTIQFGCKNIAFLRYNHYVMRYFFKNIAFFSPLFSYDMESIFIRDNCNNSRRNKNTVLGEAKKDTFFEGEGYLINI